MAVSKVTLNGSTIIDITDTTATSSRIQQSYGAYGADGVWVSGSIVDGNNSEYGIIDDDSALVGVGLVGDMIIE